MSLAENKNQMLKLLEDTIKDTPNEISDTKDASHTMTVKGLCADASFELVKQIVFSAVQETLDAKSEPKTHLHALCSVFNAYQKCHKDIRDVCHSVLKVNLEEQESSNSVRKITDKLNQQIFTFVTKSDTSMNGHKRFYPELFISSTEEFTKTNIEEVLMFVQLAKTLTRESIPKNEFSVIDYSKAVLSGSLTDDFVEYPILKHCEQYLVAIDIHIVRAITKATEFNDTTACKVMQLLNWRNRFLKYASESIFVTSSTKRRKHLREDIVPLLYVHSKWLRKHLMTELFKHLPTDHKLIDSFNSKVQEITNQYDQDNTELMKLSKKLKKLYGQPKLYESKDEYDRSVRRSTAYGRLTLNVNQPLSKQLDKLSVDCASVTDLSLALDVPDNNTLTIIEENISKIAQAKSSQAVSEAMLLPVTSYVVQRVLSLLQTSLYDIVSKLSCEGSQATGTDVTVLSYLVQLSRLSKGFPPALLNLLEVILKTVEGQDMQR